MTYLEILNRDVPLIVSASQNCARQGICLPIRLYYSHEAILGMPSGLDSHVPGFGWTDSGIEIPISLPYSRYWQFVHDRFRNVPLFA